MKKLLLMFMVPFVGNAQSIELTIPRDIVGATFGITAYSGLHETRLDSVVADSTVINLTTDLVEDGMARLELNGNKLADLVVLRNSPLHGSLVMSGNGITVKWNNSTENEALEKLLDLSAQYSEAVERLSGYMESIPEFHPKHNAIDDSLQATYRTILSAYNMSLHKLRTTHRGTYTADILVGLDALPMREDREEWTAEFDNDPAFLHRHFFANVNFSDSRTATNPYLKNKILEYIYTYIVKDERGLKDGIDVIMAKADRNTDVKKACAEILIGFFSDQGISEYVDYLNQEHLAGCNMDFEGGIGEIIARSSPYRVGDMVTSAMITDHRGHTSDLTSTEKPYNVLMFHASWCSHCQEEIPATGSFLDLYSKTVELKAVSIDTTAAGHQLSMRGFPGSVQHYCDLKGWDSSVAEQFGISATPSFILLSRAKEYLGRASSLLSLTGLINDQKMSAE